MSGKDDFWAMATRLVDQMCERCPECGGRKLKDQRCEDCSAPPRRGLVSAKPLQQELARRQKRGDLTWEQLAKNCGLSSRTILRIFAADWVTIKVADRVAIGLGLHPNDIWGMEWQWPS